MINTGKIYRMLVAGAVMLLAAGCSYVEDPGRPCPPVESDGNVHLNFVMTSDAKLVGGDTRADDQPGHTEEGPDLELEETINTDDFAFYIFVGQTQEGGTIDWDNAKLLYANYDINHSTDPYTMITGSQGSYNVTVTLPNEQFESILGHPLDPESDAAVNFRMVLLANSTGGYGWGIANYEKLPHAAGSTTYRELISEAEKIYVKYSDMHEDSPDNWGDIAEGVFKGYIPMYGNLFKPVTEKDLCASRPYERLFLGDVWMLRSYAKVRIHDNIQDKDGAFPRLHSAVLTYTTPNAYMLPADAAGYQNGQQVHTLRECEENAWNVNYGEETSLQMPFISNLKRTLISYLPEQKIQQAMPVLVVRIQTSKFDSSEESQEGELTYQPKSDTDLEEHTRTFTVPLWGYNGQQFTWGDQILRNHVYDINVDYKNGALLTLRATVNDWTQNSLELDFMQNPGVSQTVEWVNDTYSRIDNTTGQLYLKPWDNDGNRTAAKCTFTIDAPKDAEWTAYLVTTAGNPGAFAFKTGESGGAAVTAETVSGRTGESATLEIVSVNPAPTEDNSAILQVVVAMDGGTRFMEARVAGGAIKNWTVNQAKQ